LPSISVVVVVMVMMVVMVMPPPDHDVMVMMVVTDLHRNLGDLVGGPVGLPRVFGF